METSTEPSPSVPPSACTRCGTFAPLVDNGWRSLCAPCGELARHPLEGTAPHVSTLVTATARIWLDLWSFAVPLALLFAVPHALAVWLLAPPWWFATLYAAVIGSFAEALLLSVAAEWAFGGRRDVRRALPRVEQRYFAVVGVNLLTNALVLAGMYTCVLGVFAIAVTLAAVPIALFERANPLIAVRDSWRRSRGHRLRLFLLAAMVTLPLVVLSDLPNILVGALRPWHLALTTRQLSVMGVANVFVVALLNTVPQLLQLAVWQATRPAAPKPG